MPIIELMYTVTLCGTKIVNSRIHKVQRIMGGIFLVR
jgi:hypothetical protein